ncbi:MAG: SusC/RagA family TonB-linked outer membrane protein [Chitinophagaceae bacterium]
MYLKLLLKAIALPVLCVLFTLPLFSQNKIITGKVIDSKDTSGVAGASVTIKGTKIGAQTNADGNFQISVPPTATTLVVSSVGFDQQEISIAGKTSVEVNLVAANAALNEVVVVGYGTSRKKDLTGSVSSIKAKDFNQGVIAAPDQLLQNKVPGLEVTSNSGQPGAATTIKIRGNSSIRASNNPLYVVDGVPLDGRSARPSISLGNNGLGFGTTPESNPLLYINPNDIAQIDVLKDASSAAIYGSRGANGVIVITTKKGLSGPPKLEFGTSFGVAGYMKKYKVLTADEYRSAQSKYGLDTFKFNQGGSVDALKEIAQHKLSQNYSLALSGGNENGRFRASFLGSSTEGLIKKSSLDKYIGTFTGQYKFFDQKLSIDFGLIAAHYTENLSNISNTAGSQGNILSAALIWNPTAPFYKDGKYVLTSNGVANPLAVSDAFGDVSNVNTFLANISAGYKLAKGLDYKFLYAINHGTGDRKINIEGFLEGFQNLSGQGYGIIGNAQLTSQTFTHTLNYRTAISQSLSFEALGGYEYWKTNYSNASIAASGFNTNLDQSNRINIPYTSIFQNAKTQYPYIPTIEPTVELQSYFGRVNFNLLDKFLLTGTIRADGSSKFGKNNKYGYFPSVGAKWVISNEDFMKNSGVFSNLGLRGSWGMTGNQEYPAGASQEQFRLSSYNTAGQTIVANPNLKWETTSAFNIGADFAFGKGRIYGTIDYYNKNTKNILFQTNSIQPAPNSIYFINIPANLINSGIEFSIGSNIINKDDFTWDINFNVAYNKNLLKNFFDINTGLPLTIKTGTIDGQGVSGTLAQVITNNQPVNEFNLKQFSGFDASGNQKINDAPTYAGDPNPHVIGGFSTTLRYKKVTFSLNTGGAFGYMIYNNTATSVTNINGITSGRNIDVEAFKSGESKSSGAAASTRFLEKGDYVKLRNATFRYDVGSVGKYVKNLSCFVSGTNLFVITKFKGFDPEVNVDKSTNSYPSRSIEYIPYPTPRTVSLGLNFSL